MLKSSMKVFEECSLLRISGTEGRNKYLCEKWKHNDGNRGSLKSKANLIRKTLTLQNLRVPHSTPIHLRFYRQSSNWKPRTLSDNTNQERDKNKNIYLHHRKYILDFFVFTLYSQEPTSWEAWPFAKGVSKQHAPQDTTYLESVRAAA